ncbi:hypothetical protein NHQ30_008524 [Ciborinia camelliae]|nr:hypothetical protein NHQ30_008524 [Ciborinia camelliae]
MCVPNAMPCIRYLSLHLLLGPRADLAAALLPLHPTRHADLGIPHKLPDDIDPALVAGQLGIEFLGQLVQRRQPRPRHRGEIVVLVVQAHVVGQHIQRAVVGKRLRDQHARLWVPRCVVLFLEDVVLGDEVPGAGVQRSGEKGGEDEVVEWLVGVGVFYEQDVEEELRDDVEDVDRGERDRVHEDGSDGVEEDLEGAEEGFAEQGIQKQGFEARGQVRVESIHAQRFMVR